MRYILLILVLTTGFATGANAVDKTCTAYTANCIRQNGNGQSEASQCRAAGATCMQSGTFVGPKTGQVWTVKRK
jgi:hypothetical protein